MVTLIKPEAKLKITNFENSTYQVEKKLVKSKIYLNSKFYQTLFIMVFTLCTFLIFPESPQESDFLCKKYHPKEACIVW